MQIISLLVLFLVASASAASVPTQSESVSSSNTVSNSNQQQNAPVVPNAPAPVAPGNVGASSNVVEGPSIEQPPHHHQSVAGYYSAPPGVIQVVSSEQQSGSNKPIAGVRNFAAEQYGQPESSAIPPNYKPFGAFGLYIGGSQPDGYYTNYYKALSNSYEAKPQVGEVKPVASSALSPVLRQAGSSPYIGGDFYSFAYSPSDLNVAPRSAAVEPISRSISHSAGPALSPVQVGAQVYGTPASFESNYEVSPYADTYATKKVGAAYAQKEVSREGVKDAPRQQPAKGYQSRVYVYPSAAPVPLVPYSAGAYSAGAYSAYAPAVSGGQQGPQQYSQPRVVAYPVPVGSTIIGSQPQSSSDSSYGIHGYTHYAVKPTVVNVDPVTGRYPSYGAYPQVYSSQLHYSHGQFVPSYHGEIQHAPVQPSQVDGVSEKAENEDKAINNQVQKSS